MTTTVAPAAGRGALASLASLLGAHRGRLAIAALVFAIKDSPLWLMPVVIARVIDLVVDEAPVTDLWLYSLVGAILLAQNYPAHMLFTRLFSGVVRSIAAGLRTALATRMQTLSISYHARSSSALVQSKIVRDVESVEVLVQQGAPPALSGAATFIGALVMTSIRVPIFVPALLVAVPLAALLVGSVRKRSRLRNETFRRRVENLSTSVSEMASMVELTRAHGIEDVAVNRVARSAEDVRSAGVALDLLNGRFGSVSWMLFQALALGCVVFAAFVSMSGFADVSAGDVVLLSTYVALLTGSVISLTGLAPVFARGLDAIGSIAEILQDPDVEQNAGRDPVHDPACSIAFEGVGFAYPGEESVAVEGVDLELRPNHLVALVGSSGSGKSTILNLSLGFLRPTSGRVLLDGRDMNELDLRTFRHYVSVVPQESVLFDGSIRDNVTYGMADVSDERLDLALDAANAGDFVRRLHSGVETFVGDRGAQLSGGQRQRLALARALIRDPRLLLLDEATSALDPESEALIRDSVLRASKGRSTLVIAHRLSTVMVADCIAVVEHGNIVERGTHEDLLDLGGRYSQLHRAQMT